MLERRRARHQALHILYQREITDESLSGILATGTYSGEDGEPSDFCRELLMGVESHQSTIDATIESISENWTLSRMPLVDRNILRIAVYEIMFEDDIPDSVSINEAVEMAKVYGGDDSSKFVNGILGRLAEEHMHEKAVPGEPA
jgi:transcription antitermination protein NusB